MIKKRYAVALKKCGTRDGVTFPRKYPAVARKRYPVALIFAPSTKRYAVMGFFKTLPRHGYKKRYHVMGIGIFQVRKKRYAVARFSGVATGTVAA